MSSFFCDTVQLSIFSCLSFMKVWYCSVLHIAELHGRKMDARGCSESLYSALTSVICLNPRSSGHLQAWCGFAVETMELATPVDIPQQPAPGSTSLLGADLKPAQLKPGVFSRAAHMREVARQQLANLPGGAR